MPKAVRVNNGAGDFYAWRIDCPGCGGSHLFTAGWSFNGNPDRPTFTPSMLERSGHYIPEHKAGESCWCTWNREHPDDPAPFTCYVCHSFVTDGRIQFLSDCTHSLAGRAVDLPEV